MNRDGRRVLDAVTFTVPPASVTGLLGPSGSGKTTLMRAIVGIQKVEAGQVLVLGEPAGSARLRRTVGYMTQAPSVYPDLTVRENARYFGALYHADSRAAERAIEDVGLSGAAGQLVSTLSGVQRARASLACVLLGNPHLLILDEPTVGQDPVLRRDLWRHFHELAAAGATLLVSSHVMDEAKRCDRLLLLREGRLLAEGTPGEICDATGTTDLDEAFLRLVESADAAGPR